MLTRQNAKLNFLKSSIKIKTETHDLKLMKPRHNKYKCVINFRSNETTIYNLSAVGHTNVNRTKNETYKNIHLKILNKTLKPALQC